MRLGELLPFPHLPHYFIFNLQGPVCIHVRVPPCSRETIREVNSAYRLGHQRKTRCGVQRCQKGHVKQQALRSNRREEKSLWLEKAV